MKTVAILQSNYIPWKGYFDIINRCDLFVILDEVQSTKNDWRNRNRIKTNGGTQWLTIPTRHSNALRINEVTVANNRWAQKHWRTIHQSYSRAPAMMALAGPISGLYEQAAKLELLSDVNRIFLDSLCKMVGIGTPIVNAGDLVELSVLDNLEPTARLVEICRATGATNYLSGPSAKDYLDISQFDAAGVHVDWMSYAQYPEYGQLHGEFRHDVSILDQLLMTYPNSLSYLKQS